MRDKDGWNLSQKQRDKYLQSVKMLYGTPKRETVGAVQPTLSLGDLNLIHEVHGRQQSLALPKVPRGTPKPKAIKEWREQVAIYSWTQSIQVLRGFVMKFDNEGRRSVVQAAVAKRMGLLAGTSDLFIAYPVYGHHGLWLEIKQNRKYTPSERSKDTWKRQEEFQARMRGVGFAACFAFGAEDGITIIRNYMNGTLPRKD